MRTLAGVGVSPGNETGPVVRFVPVTITEPPAEPAPADRAAEAARVREAITSVAQDLERRAGSASGDSADVLQATAMIAADPGLGETVDGLVAQGTPGDRAVWDAMNGYRELLAASGGYLAERVADLDDVRDRIIATLHGEPMPGIPNPHYPFVLVARDLAPADTATLVPGQVLALVTEEGGPTSHTAILAKALGIPAVVACRGALELADGTNVIVDGAKGQVTIDPDDEATREAKRLAALRAALPTTIAGKAVTTDGYEIPLYANIGDAAGMASAMAVGAGGVGLFRTEFLYLDRAVEPTREEQVRAYRAVFDQAGGKRIVVRTLDAGADKPLAFLDLGEEPNPALGVRGFRTAKVRPDILENQLAAIAEAADGADAEVWVMAPMVATIEEAKDFASRVHGHGLQNAGIMVEVPAIALTARHVMGLVDFVSVGTNDLGQYAMAADRMSGSLAPLLSPWQPAMLQLVRFTAEAAIDQRTPVGVCGEAAGDPALAVVLMGLGVTSLSMAPRSLPEVAEVIASVSLDQARLLAAKAVAAPTATIGRHIIRAGIPRLAELGL
jgi:phosphoenolpyruvate-protein phosphotransferase (PTS system enzyme I)